MQILDGQPAQDIAAQDRVALAESAVGYSWPLKVPVLAITF